MSTIIYMSRDLDGNDEPHQAKYYLWNAPPEPHSHNGKVVWCSSNAHHLPIGKSILNEADRLDLGLPICEPGACMKLVISVKQHTAKQERAVKNA